MSEGREESEERAGSVGLAEHAEHAEHVGLGERKVCKVHKLGEVRKWGKVRE